MQRCSLLANKPTHRKYTLPASEYNVRLTRGCQRLCVCKAKDVSQAPEPGVCRSDCGVGKRQIVLTSACWPACSCLTGQKGTWYNKYFAYVMDHGMQGYEESIQPVKSRVFARLFKGGNVHDVLEMGIGTGPNLRYYPRQDDLRVTGVDPNPEMLPYATQAAKAAGLDAGRFRPVTGFGEELPADTASYDAVVCTLVLCSVRDQQRVLSEIARVLRPGGQLLFVEHVLAPPARPLTRTAQKALTPLQRLLADGCHLNRDTLAAIQAGGQFAAVDAESFDVENASLIAPHVAGIATKA